jgi:UDP-glucose 4-epimerase
MKRLLITGATGFIGSRVLHNLVSSGRAVTVVLRETSDTQRIQDLLSHCTVVHVDLGNTLDLQKSISYLRPTQVLHLAWDGVKGADRNNDLQIRNIFNTLNLYQITKKYGCNQFVGLGSQAEYGLLSGRITESALTRPTTLYGASKLACAQVLGRLASADGGHFCWVRLFSSYGEGDNSTWMLSYLTRELLEGRRPRLTPGEQLWDYIHVDDVATGVIAALDKCIDGVFNLGSGKARPIREIVKILRDMIDVSLPLGFGELPYRDDQVMHLEADITALSLATGWSPTIELEEGLSRLVEWHRQQLLRAPPIKDPSRPARTSPAS